MPMPIRNAIIALAGKIYTQKAIIKRSHRFGVKLCIEKNQALEHGLLHSKMLQTRSVLPDLL